MNRFLNFAIDLLIALWWLGLAVGTVLWILYDTGLASPAEPTRPLTARAAVACAATRPADTDTRFLSLHWVDDEEELAIWKKRLDFVLNSLSRRRRLIPTAVVPGSGGTLLCFSLRSYGIPMESWDDLLYRGSGPLRIFGKKEKCEPYFYLDTPRADGKTDTVTHPGVDGPDMRALITRCGTAYPIVRGDWFLFHVLLPPAYYNFLGFKADDDFDKLVRFREADRDDLATKGIVVASLETRLNNGTLLRTPTVLGHYWESFGYRTSVNGDYLLRNILRKTFDEKLVLATLPNGLQAYVAVDKDDKTLLTHSDPQIEINRNPERKWNNKVLFPGASCMMCHAKGLREITDEVRLLADVREDIGILPKVGHIVRTKAEAEKVLADQEKTNDLFFEDLDAKIAEDQRRYARAVWACNELTPEENREALEDSFVEYAQGKITLRTVARDVGLTEAALWALLQRGVNLDPGLVQLKIGRPIRRDTYEAHALPQLGIILAASD